MRKQQQTSLMMLALYAILICAMLILAVAGARLYTAAMQSKSSNSSSRIRRTGLCPASARARGNGGLPAPAGQ